MRFRLLEYGVSAVLATAILLNCALLVRSRYRAAQPPVEVSIYRTGIDVSPSLPSATYAGTGQRLADVQSHVRKGWVVRYVSKNCGYCETDIHGKALLTELERLDFSVTNLLPRAGEDIADQGFDRTAVQATFVPIEWIKQFRLTVTPTLMIFNSEGKLVWHHQGTLGPHHLIEARRAVASLDVIARR